jgi:LPPG:FO 2-phospho-L-lactate transferase
MMAELGSPVSSLAVARYYGLLIDALLIDEVDRALIAEHSESDPVLLVDKTVMKTRDDRVRLARSCLSLIEKIRRR